MLSRRRFTALLGATALGSLAAPALIKPSFAQGAAPLVPRGIGDDVARQARFVSEQPVVDEDDATVAPVGLEAAEHVD